VADLSAQQHLTLLVGTIEEFLGGVLSAPAFDDLYRSRFSELPLGLDAATFEIVENLAFACEDYVEDPELRDPGDLDDDELRQAARTTLDALRTAGWA